MTEHAKYAEIARLCESTKKTVEDLGAQLLELLAENAELKRQIKEM
jgi:hypothetical protein